MKDTTEQYIKDQIETIAKRRIYRKVFDMFSNKTEKEVIQMYLLKQVKRQDYLNFMEFKGWEPVKFTGKKQNKELVNFLNQLI